MTQPPPPTNPAEMVRAAYARSNVLLDPGDGAAVGHYLAEVADKAAGLLRKALLLGDGDFAPLFDLLSCVSALTDICGYPRTPTAADVTAALTAELGRDPVQAHTQLCGLLDSVLAGNAKVDAALEVEVGPRLAANAPPAEWRAQVAAHAAYMHAAKLARDLAVPAPNSPAGPDITPDMLGRMADLLEGRAAEAVQTAGPPDPLGPKAATFRRFIAVVAELTNEQTARLQWDADADSGGYRREAAAGRAYRAAVAAGRWAYAQEMVERAPGAAFDPKLALLVADLIDPEDFAVLTGPWFAAFGRWPWQDGGVR